MGLFTSLLFCLFSSDNMNKDIWNSPTCKHCFLPNWVRVMLVLKHLTSSMLISINTTDAVCLCWHRFLMHWPQTSVHNLNPMLSNLRSVYMSCQNGLKLKLWRWKNKTGSWIWISCCSFSQFFLSKSWQRGKICRDRCVPSACP